MNPKYGRSALWVHNNETKVTRDAQAELGSFKSSGVNFKLALWDPKVNGVRYLKTLIYNLAAGLSAENRARLEKIEHRDIGDPIAVRYDGELVCMDYLQAVFELDFIAKGLDLDGGRVLEIGAGYGRTCHAVLSNHDVASYHIVDLENSLELARSYLRAVLDDDQFAKLHFVRVDDVDETLTDAEFDLCVNIDSFAEMDEATVRNYLALVDQACRYFYVNNPVGKYLDKSLDGHAQGDEVVALAMRTGVLREVIDVHDNRSIDGQTTRFVDAYRPGKDWQPVAHDRAVPWSYYRQALYRRGTADGGR